MKIQNICIPIKSKRVIDIRPSFLPIIKAPAPKKHENSLKFLCIAFIKSRIKFLYWEFASKIAINFYTQHLTYKTEKSIFTTQIIRMTNIHIRITEIESNIKIIEEKFLFRAFNSLINFFPFISIFVREICSDFASQF